MSKPLPTVRIVWREGERVINARDFDSQRHELVEGEVLPSESPPETRTELPEGYSIRRRGSWYQLVGPDGELVGKSKRSPEEAAALIEGV